VLGNWSEEEKSRQQWLPYQHKVAEEFLATGLDPEILDFSC